MKTASHDAPASPPSDIPTATALHLFVVLARALNAVSAHAEAHVAKQGLAGAHAVIIVPSTAATACL